jgi:DNA polymerase III delta subunit
MPGLSSAVQLSVIYGDSPFLIDRAAHELVSGILEGEDLAYGLTAVDLEQAPMSDALAELQSGSLIAGTRVIWLKSIHETKADDQRRLVEPLGSLPPGTSVVMTAPTTRQRALKGPPVSAALRKLVEQTGQSVCFMTPFERELAGWVIQEARKLGKGIERRAAEQLVEMVGRDHGRLFGEIVKLATYVADAPQIDSQAVAGVASRSAEASSFELVDAIAEGDARRSLAMLPDLVPAHSAASAAIPLLGLIARHLRLIWQTSFLAENKVAIDRRGKVDESLSSLLPDEQNVLQAARTSFVARKLAAHARNLEDRKVALALERVLYADKALKGQTDEYLDPRLIVERLVIELCLLFHSGARTRGSR